MIYVVEIVAAVDGAGNTQTFLFSTRGFTTGTSDTPANTTARERLRQPLNYSRALDPAVPLGLVQTGYGECVVLNPDGALDALVRYGVGNRSFTLRASEDGGAYPTAWTTLLVASMDRIEARGSELRIILRDGARSYLDKPICTSFAGTGGLEGHAALAGTPKPRTYGSPFNVPLVRINDGSGGDIYMISDKANCWPQTAFDGRAAITNFAHSETTYAGIAGLSVTAGQVARCTEVSICKLGSVPSKPATCDPSAWDGGYRNASGKVLQDLLTDAGVTMAGGIAASSWGGLGYWVRDASTTYATVLDEMLRSCAAYGWFDSSGTFQADQWSAASSGSVWTFSPANAREPTLRLVPPRDPIVLNGPRNFNPLSLSDSATGISIEYRGLLSKELPFSERSSASSAQYARRDPLEIAWTGYAANPSGNSVPVNAPSGKVGAFATLFGTARDVIEVTAPATLALLTTVDLGDPVTVRWPRWSLDAGVLVRVSGVRYELATGTVTYTLWR